MNINLKLLSQAINQLSTVKAKHENESMISINGIQITITGNLAKCGKRMSTRFENVKVLLSDLSSIKAFPASPQTITEISIRYAYLEHESKQLEALKLKYHE